METRSDELSHMVPDSRMSRDVELLMSLSLVWWYGDFEEIRSVEGRV
jgi:hypothetical protein